MRAITICGLVLIATVNPATCAAKAEGVTSADMMRQTWRTQKGYTVFVVQQVYNRVVSLKLPRPFIIANRAQTPGFSIMEFVPDGQDVHNWTQMITVTGRLGAGAARIDDVQLAALLEPKGCPGKVFQDLGPTPSLDGVSGRFIVIGCGAADQDGSERAAIAVFRDTDNSWTVQYAERNHGRAPFNEAAALDRIKSLEPQVIPAAARAATAQ